MSDRTRRLYFDLLAYGRHFETCTKGRVIVPASKWRAAIRVKACSCGFDAALDNQAHIDEIARPEGGTGR